MKKVSVFFQTIWPAISKRDFLIILLLCMVSILLKYPALGNNDNQRAELLLINRMLDPSYIKNDWFLNAMSGDHLRAFFDRFAIFFSHIFGSVEIAFFVIFAVMTIFFAVYVFKLAILLFNNTKIAYFSVFLVIFGGKFALASSGIFFTTLVPAVMAVYFAPAIFYYFFKNNFSISFILLGIATLFHLQIGVHLFLIFFIFLLISRPFFSKEKLKLLAKNLFWYLLFSAYAVVPYFLSSLHAQKYPADLIIKIIKFRAPWHFFPFSWPIISYIIFFLFMAITIYELYLYNKENNILAGKIRKVFLIIAAFLVFDIIFVEIIPIKLVVLTELFRMSIYLILFGYLLIARHIYLNFQKSNGLQKVFYILFVFSCLDGIISQVHYLFVFLAIIFLAFVIIQQKFQKNIFEAIYKYFAVKKRLFFFIFAIIFLTAAIYIFMRTIVPADLQAILESASSFFQQIDFLWSVALVFVIIVFFLFIKKRFDFLGLVVGLLLLATFSILRPQAKEQVAANQVPTINFIKNHTPPGSVFLTTPKGTDFRYYTKRPVVVDFLNFSTEQSIMVEWYQRMLDIGNFDKDPGNISLIDVHNGYKQLTEEKIIKLKQKYNIQYAIFNKKKKLNFPIVYKNKQYVIYKITD